MNKRLGLIAGAGLLGLAGCGDSAIVEKCIDEGKSAKWCRCSDRVLRSELSNEEYRIAEEAVKDDGDSLQDAVKDKGPAFALTFMGKMAGAGMKITERCDGK